jgi:glycosyltransferase involved in cell wall biosynthesis
MYEFIASELESGKIDIFHPTYYNTYFLSLVKKNKVPYVLTVHDLIHEKYPNYFENIDITLREKRETILGADRIIAISENTKLDVMNYYHIQNEKIDVVYHGYYDLKTPSISSIPDKKKYILFVGNRNYYKNFDFFIQSILQLFCDYPELQIVAAGGGGFSDQEKLMYKDLISAKKITHVPVRNDSELISLYMNAIAFVFPSLYEGFGMPLLEAMSAGCPVICSNSSSFPEVAGDSAVYFDPTNSKSIEETVREVLSSKSLQISLIRKGFNNLNRFSWEKSALETLNVYKKALGKI